ncbi:hypothetical protein [Rosistilla oblonga]|uniref:hypothetical protein n=1 Tax=Rosistilla oblonga TaxID=2527990 RepID=UPI003A987683
MLFNRVLSVTLLFFGLLPAGCAHHQLRLQTVKQANTVADVHTQQVLDNLAKFAHNCDAIPHFSFPNAGASGVTGQVNGNAGFNFNPFRLTLWNFGFGGNQGMSNSYTMTPINDPRKLELMRCVYQRAVSTCCRCNESGSCPNCEKRLNKFYLGNETVSQTGKVTSDGNPIYDYGGLEIYQTKDIFGEDYYAYVNTNERVAIDERLKKRMYVPNTVNLHTQQTGKITADCLYSDCWFHVEKSRKVPKACVHAGHYRGTSVWVDSCHVDQLTKLTMTVLDIALNDPPAGRTKEVVVYLDADKKPVQHKDQTAFQVTANIPFGSDVQTVVPKATPQALLNDIAHSRAIQAKNTAEIQRVFSESPAVARKLLDQGSAIRSGSAMTIDEVNANDSPLNESEAMELADLLFSPQSKVESALQKSRSDDALAPMFTPIDKAIRNFAAANVSYQDTKVQEAEIVRLESQIRDLTRVEVERKSIEQLPATHTAIPNAGFLQFDQNLRALTP